MEHQTNEQEGLKIVRNFNAPKTLVFNAFENADAFAAWWGPVGMPVTVSSFDFQHGGKLHYKMQGNGQTMWGLFVFRNINRPDLLEFVSSFSDENGNVCPPPFPMDFPREVFNRLTLEENDGITTLTLSGHPINASPEQEAAYLAMIPNMAHGFSGTLDQLDAYLSKSK